MDTIISSRSGTTLDKVPSSNNQDCSPKNEQLSNHAHSDLIVVPAYCCDALASQPLAKGGEQISPSFETPPLNATHCKAKDTPKVRRKSDDIRKTKSLPSIRVSESLYAQISDAATNFNKTKTEFVVDAILAHLTKSDKVYNDYHKRIYIPNSDLISEINLAGNLLNQIAHALWLVYRNGDVADIVKVYAELLVIRRLLSNVIPFSITCYKTEESTNVG